jgi:hypothetical protein
MRIAALRLLVLLSATPTIVSGKWQLDSGASEDAHARLQAAMNKGATSESEPTPGPAAGGRSGRRGGRAGGGGGTRTDAITAGADDTIATGEFLTAPERIEIGQAGTAVTVTSGDATLQLDMTADWLRNPDGRSVRARAKEAALVVESKWDSGTRLRTTYMALRDGGLEAVSHVELSSRVSATVRRVYRTR